MDATVLTPNMPVLNGMDAIKAGLKPILDDPNFKIMFSHARVDVAKSGDIGYSQGPCRMTMTDPATKKPADDPCKYLTVWKKQPDNSWKAVEDTFNSDAAPPVPKK